MTGLGKAGGGARSVSAQPTAEDPRGLAAACDTSAEVEGA